MPENDLTEAWRPVVGYESLYSVSNHGRVRRDAQSPGARKGLILKGYSDLAGYQQVVLYYGKRKSGRTLLVHRLVAAAFIGPCPCGMEVNHKNGDKGDNRSDELEYMTHQQNTRHAIEILGHSRTGEDNAAAKLTEAKVADIRRRHSAGSISQRKLAAAFGVSQKLIHLIVHRKIWTHC